MSAEERVREQFRVIETADLGMAKQVGWFPPSPAYVLRMRLALRRPGRRVRQPAQRSARARVVR
jgi:hypothetical protein